MKYFITSSVKKDFKEAVALAKELGCNLEISRMTSYNEDVDAVLPERLDYYKSELNGFKGNLNIHSFFIDLTPVSIDPHIQSISRRRFEQALEAAKFLNAKTIVYHTSFREQVKFSDYHKSFKEGFISYWKEFIKQFEDCGITAVLENVEEKSPDFIFDVLKEVNSPYLKASIDIGHINIHSKIPVTDWIKKYDKLLYHMHFHNNDTTDDMHHSLLNGTLDVENIIKTINSLGLEPKIVLEIFKENEIRESLDFLKKLEEKEKIQCL